MLPFWPSPTDPTTTSRCCSTTAAAPIDTAGGTEANDVARWDSQTWLPLGSGMSGIVKALTEYHGEVIAGGSFTTAGGQVLAFWARWRPVGPLSDLDGDCSVGASDLLLLLANWGNPYGAGDLLALLADLGPCP